MEDKSTGASSSSSNLHLVAHPRAKSKVWKYFGFDTDADGCILHWKRIYCRICMAQIAYSGNTSNLSYHLEKNHPDEFCEFVKSNTEQMRGRSPQPIPRSSLRRRWGWRWPRRRAISIRWSPRPRHLSATKACWGMRAAGRTTSP